jgi:hypothetical protein
MRSGDCGRTPLAWLPSSAVDPIALRSELDLAAWDARALEGRSLALWLEPRPWTGYTLTHSDGRRVAWIEDPPSCEYAPQALTGNGALAMGREHVASRRYVVVDQASSAELVSIVPWRVRRGADLESAFGERLRLLAPLLAADWRVRDGSRAVVLRLSSQPREAARMWLEGGRHSALDLTMVVAIVYTVLTLDALTSLGASTGGAGGGG